MQHLTKLNVGWVRLDARGGGGYKHWSGVCGGLLVYPGAIDASAQLSLGWRLSVVYCVAISETLLRFGVEDEDQQ